MKIKKFLRWLGSFVLCFITIYLIVFFGGWKFFESGDPILIELGAALILSIFVSAANEVTTDLENRVKSLEEKVKTLEKCGEDQ